VQIVGGEMIMDEISYTEFRKSLKTCLDTVQTSHAPLHITRHQGGDAVLVSLEEYASFQETLHLLSSPRNADRLAESISLLETGNFEERDLIE
jgi:antitoxin YefM